jgi:hypothetical protein
MASGDRTLKLSLLADTKNLVDGLKKGEKETETFGDKIESINKKVGLAFAAMGAAATGMAIKFTKDAIGAASAMEETISKIGVVFGDSAKEVEKFASTAATNIGQSSQQALDAAATFAIFGKSAGLSGKALVDFSTDFVTLASDLASFNNTTPEEAINAIGAALRGEAEPLRRFGVLLDDATLKAAAMEMGIYSGSGALTAQQKVLAAQKVIMEQTSLAQGDFTRTSDGLANSQRSIEAAVKDAQVQLGQALLPVVQQLATYVKNTLVPNLSAFIAGLTGKGSLTDGFNQSQLAAVEWGKKARTVFDALVALKEEAAFVAAALAGIWVVSKIQAAVVATIGFINLLIKAYNALKASAIVAAVASRLALNPLAGAAASAAIFAVIGAAAKLADDFDTDAAAATQSYNEQRQAQIAAASRGATGSGLTGVTSSSGVNFPTISGATTVGTGTGSKITTNVKPAPTLIEEVTQENFLKSLEGTGNFDVGRFRMAENGDRPISSNVGNNFNPGSFRMAENAGITINVNAPSVIDETGFTRAVQLAIEQTNRRGTGGGSSAQIL